MCNIDYTFITSFPLSFYKPHERFSKTINHLTEIYKKEVVKKTGDNHGENYQEFENPPHKNIDYNTIKNIERLP